MRSRLAPSDCRSASRTAAAYEDGDQGPARVRVPGRKPGAVRPASKGRPPVVGGRANQQT
jgi:hypothetical protein